MKTDQMHDRSKSAEEKDLELEHADKRSEARIEHPPGNVLAPDPYTLDASEDDDPILAELRRAREELAAEFGYGTDQYREHLRRVTFLCGNDVVARSRSGEFEVIFKALISTSLG